MPNLRGASPVDRDDGGPSYAARAGGKGESRVGDVDGVWRGGVIRSLTGVASASRPHTGCAGRSDRCSKGERSGMSNQGGSAINPKERYAPGWETGAWSATSVDLTVSRTTGSRGG